MGGGHRPPMGGHHRPPMGGGHRPPMRPPMGGHHRPPMHYGGWGHRPYRRGVGCCGPMCLIALGVVAAVALILL